MNVFLKFFVTLGPIGFFRGSGTYASFIAVIFAYLINYFFGHYVLITITFLITIFGWFLTKLYLLEKNEKDPPEVVIDEVSGQMIASFFAGSSFQLYLFSFIIFRTLDIFKPFPINKFENIKGSFGVMLDDVVAGIFTFILIILIRNL